MLWIVVNLFKPRNALVKPALMLFSFQVVISVDKCFKKRCILYLNIVAVFYFIPIY